MDADDANVIITGNDIVEIDAQLRDLCKSLLKTAMESALI